MATKGDIVQIVEINGLTNEVVERNATAEEILQHEADMAFSAERRATEETKAIAKVALLERLGITAEEAAILLS